MSSFPVLKNHGQNPSDIVGSLHLKGGFAEKLAEGLLAFDCGIKNGRLVEVSLVTACSRPSMGARWERREKFNEGKQKREETYRAFIDKAKRICGDELEDDGMNALPIILAKLELFEEFMKLNEAEAGIPRLTIQGFIRAAVTRWELNEGQAERFRASLIEVITEAIRENMEGETT